MMDDIFVGTVGSLASSFTVGYVVWMLRGGVLLSSLMAQMPAWKFIDPIVILANYDRDDDADDDDSIQAIVERGVNQRVDSETLDDVHDADGAFPKA